MALKIRLRRMGRKKAPTYRIVVAESTMPRDGRFVDRVGHYNPRNEPITLVVDRERTLAWLEKGARPTDTVQSLLKKAGIYKDAPEVAAEGVAETVKQAAGDAADAVKKAAGTAATVVKDAAGDVAEAVTGGEAEAPAEAEAAAPAEAETEEAAEAKE